MQSDRNNFYGDDVLDSINIFFRDEDNIWNKLYEKQNYSDFDSLKLLNKGSNDGKRRRPDRVKKPLVKIPVDLVTDFWFGSRIPWKLSKKYAAFS